VEAEVVILMAAGAVPETARRTRCAF
jgi:hypothetical protein